MAATLGYVPARHEASTYIMSMGPLAAAVFVAREAPGGQRRYDVMSSAE